jgi:fatty acid desaturase
MTGAFQELGPGATASDFDALDKRTLVDRAGTAFLRFRQTLAPRFVRVWADLLAGYLALAALVLVAAQTRLPGLALAAVAAAGAVGIGFVMAYIQLFFHEAAHYNIAPTRLRNDRLADALIGSLMGQSVAQYRAIHFDHHRYLGTTRDTERSYFDPLTPRFILESLAGVRVLKVLLTRQQAARGDTGVGGATRKGGMYNRQVLLGVALHGALLGLALWYRQWALLAAWTVGVATVFPFFGAVRQVLEHRDENARPDVDYRVVDHGAHNRVFGRGPLASTFGAAGFNRHLLHHWEPQVSYTRLADLEHFLQDSPAAPALAAHRRTYLGMFLTLLGESGRDA